MQFRKSTQQDLDYVRQNPYEGSLKHYPYSDVAEENCFTAIFKDEIVGLGGLVVHWKGMAEAWLILTDHCRKDGLHGIIALGAIRDKMEELIEENKTVRVQAAVRVDFPIAIKMIEFLGFKRESRMEKYCPDGCDSYRYVKFYDREQ